MLSEMDRKTQRPRHTRQEVNVYINNNKITRILGLQIHRHRLLVLRSLLILYPLPQINSMKLSSKSFSKRLEFLVTATHCLSFRTQIFLVFFGFRFGVDVVFVVAAALGLLFSIECHTVIIIVIAFHVAGQSEMERFC